MSHHDDMAIAAPTTRRPTRHEIAEADEMTTRQPLHGRTPYHDADAEMLLPMYAIRDTRAPDAPTRESPQRQ